MGLLWPGMFARFGDVIGLPFALEGIFFFLEAIFISIYLLRLEAPEALGPLLDGGADPDRRACWAP